MDALRRLLESLEAEILPQNDSLVHEGLKQLAKALKAVVIDEDGGTLIGWSKIQLDQVLAILNAVVCSSVDLPAGEGYAATLENLFSLTVGLCVRALECFALRPRSGVFNEQLQRRLLMLLEAATVDGKAERASGISLRETSPEFLLELSATGDQDDINNSLSGGETSARQQQEDVGSWQNILAVLSTEHVFVENDETAKEMSNRRQTMVNVSHHYAIVRYGCVQRLSALCRRLLASQMTDYEADNVGDKICFVTRLLLFLVDLTRTSPYRDFVEETVAEVVKMACSLANILKLSRDVGNLNLDSDDTQDGEGSLPRLLDALLLFSEALSPAQVLTQNLRTFLAASILDKMDTAKTRFEGTGTGTGAMQHLIVASTPQLVNYFLRLLQADQFHASESRFSFGRQLSGEDLTTGLGLECQLRSQVFMMNKVRRQSDHLQAVFPPNGDWLDKLVVVAAVLHSHGLRLRPLIDVTPSVHSEEDSATISMDSLTVASEDDALFGDLFSESGRHSVNSDETLQITCAKKVGGVHMALLQTTCQLLCFLKNYIFSPDWHRPTYEAARRHLSKEHMDFLLNIHYSQATLVGRVFDMNADQTLLVDLHKSSFDVLFALVDRGALSDTLQVHLFRQILKEGDSQCSLSRNVLVLIGKLLINRFQQQGTGASNDPLVFELWKSFADSIISKAKNVRGTEADIEKITAVLPSRFHMEVLFMAFHSVDSPGRSSIVTNLVSRLSSCRMDKQAVGSLTFWSLLVSRLVLAVKYIISHFGFFPKWLLVELSKKLRYERPETPLNGSMKEGPFPSWAAIFGRHILEGPSPGTAVQHLVDEQCINQLFDVDFPADNDNMLLANLDLKAVLCDILEAWTGRIIKSPDELILERYLFILSWDVLQYCSSSLQPSLPWEHSASTTMEFCFGLSGSISAGFDFEHADQWVEFLVQSYCNLNVSLEQGRVNLASWDLLRQGAMLALLLMPLQAGLAGQVFGQVFSRVLDNGLLLETLASILGWYVEVANFGLSLVLSQQKPSVGLILRACLPELKRTELLQKSGANLNMLKLLLRWGTSTSWTEELKGVVSGATGNRDFLPILFYGFPLSLFPGDATLVSCMLSLEGLLNVITGILRVRPDPSTSNKILATVMAMKVNGIFDSLKDPCAGLLEAVLARKEDQLLYSDVYLLKHMEDLLAHVSTSKGSLSSDLRDGLIVQAVELFNSIKSDPERRSAILLRFCSGQSEAPPEFISSFVGRGSFSSFVNVLDGFFNESVNVKVMQFFVDVLENPSSFQATFKEQLQIELLNMETNRLAAWFEQRFLGCCTIRETDASVSSAVVVREAAIRFMQAVLSGSVPSDLPEHILDALLVNLEKAFVQYDAASAKSYFTCVSQLLNGERHMKKVASAVMSVLPNIPTDGGHLEGLKYLLSFLNSMLTACGVQKVLSQTRFGKSKTSSLQNQAVTSTMKATRVARRGSEQSLHLATAADDATSVDEDEDDATSDGEMTSLDREEDDEINNNTERSLASKVCTFTSSGNNFMEQHWYFCYTCDLTVSKGCCSVCAKVCHRGHKVVYSRLSRFFCDCGAGGVRGSSCLCLKPRKYTSSGVPVPPKPAHDPPEQPLLTANHDRLLQLSDSDSETDSDEFKDGQDNVFELQVSQQDERRLLSLLSDLNLEGQLLSLSQRLLASFNLGRGTEAGGGNEEVQLGVDKVIELKGDILQLRRSYKSGSFDMKIKAEYSNSRELRSHLLSGSLSKSLLTISSRGRLAAGEGDKVTIFDVGQFIGQPTAMPVIVDKTSMKNLSRNSVRFELVHLVFNTANENYLAVAGYEDCLVFTVNPRGEVTDRLAIELALQDAHIRRIAWLPGSQVDLMVVTNRFVKIFDLSSDKISPVHYFTILEDQIVDAALLLAGQGQLLVLVLSQQGILYSQRICKGSDTGSRILTDALPLPDRFRPSKGISLHYSSYLKLVFASFHDGLTLLCRLNSDATQLSEVSSVVETDQEKTKPAGFHHWKDVFDGTGGIFSCLSSQKSNSAAIVHVGTTDIQAQHMRSAGSSVAVRVDGVASYRSMTKDRSHVMVLHDDGSLHVFLYVPTVQGTPAAETQKPATSVESEQLKKLGAALLGSRSSHSTPSFPLDFFEKTICITSDVKFGGDILRNTDSDGVKLSLAQDDGFVESPSAAGFKILVSNSNPDIVMVGCRVNVGNTSASHIPSEIRVFQRSVKLEEGVRCWYDVPFSNSEALLADEEFSITICSTFNGTSLPRIDNLEIYGRSKEDFGWKEKLEAVLDLECQHVSANSGSTASKNRKLQTASPVEQVFHETFKVLCGYYSLSRLHSSDFNVEKCKTVCAPVLEAIFESDRGSLLQSAGRRVLRALSPNKEAYYQAKDLMSLSGVGRLCPSLASKLSLSGTRRPWIVQEFSSQVRTVCKISLHRPSNLATYLERNGPSLVDALVSLLWEILLSDNLEPQTVNDLVVLTVDLIYGYAECLSAHVSTASVSPAVNLLQKLLFSAHDAVRSSSSLAISSRLLQVPLPKQTMLAMDDGGDNSRTGSVQSESGTSTVVSGQVMLEEDPGTASVQYCCDGCSTVPILRRRWHCNVCPDFDLCETCFEVMDGDQLPPPHTRDHPMSAIPIEADSSGETQDNQFTSIDDMSEESLLQMATELSLQSTAPSLNSALEGNDSSCEFSEIVETKTGSISASKSMVNSLLLNGLLENLRGWTKTTTGTVAVPVMQLFYRLATASSSQFESSGTGNLEKLVKSLLEELDIENCISVKSRTNAGEMLVLIFMFFTLLLRHWHQPGSVHGQARDGQESSEYDRACAALRQQSLVKYILNITQQLSQVFKSSSRGNDVQNGFATAPCGALLTVRREFAAGSFTPFFSDSYAKSHRGDLFGEFHKLLLESAFRLTYSLVRPGKSEKSSDKELSSKGCPGADLKLDGWQEVLCGYINNTHTTFVRKYSRRLLLHMCGSKNLYYTVRDGWQLNREVKKLLKLVNKSGGFNSVIPYERSVKMLKCLTLIGEVASARPRNWQRYCSRHSEVLPFLLTGSFCFVEELVVQTLKLLALVFYCGKDLSKKETLEATNKPDARKEKEEPSSDKGYLDMEQAVDQLVGEDEKNLKNFLDAFLLEWNATSVRSEAKAVLSGAWHHGGHAFKVLLLTLLLERVPVLPSYGQNVQEFNELLSWLLRKGTQELAANNQETVLIQGCLTGNIIKKVFETLRLQNELLANHPNSRIYSTLASLVEFDGFYLESEPCLACNSPEVPYTRMKLDNIKAETKFTDNRILVKCIGSHTIQSVTMNVHEPRRSKSIRVLNLYYNNRVVADLSELKNNMSLWKRAKSCQLNFGQTELKVEFPIPITACNFMIELDCFFENLQAASLESLQCPRCSRLVTDKHGICGNCHENAYQCRQCRNINYENLDSFLCNECGYSKYGRFEFNFMAKPSYVFDRMENDEDMKKGLAAIEAESENAHKKYQQLLGYKKPLLKLVSSIGESELDSQQKDSVQQMIVPLAGSSSFKINRKIAILGVLYGEKCKMAFDSVSKSVQTLQGLRRVLMSYLERKKTPGLSTNTVMAHRHPNHCFGCANTFVGHCLEWLQILSKIQYCRQQLVGAGILAELFENNIHQGPKSARIQARNVLCAFTEGDSGAVTELNNLIKQKVIYCLEHHRSMDVAACVRDELQLLSEACALTDDFWESRLRVVFQLLFRSIQVGARHPVIAEYIILPSLRIVSLACTPPKSDGHNGDQGETKPEEVPKPVIQDPVPTFTPAKTQEKDSEPGGINQDLLLVNYAEWRNGATYLDFVRRQYTVAQTARPAPVVQKVRKDKRGTDSVALKYILRWKRKACKHGFGDELKTFEDSSWVRELVLSACSQPIRQEMCSLIEVLCSQSIVRKSKFLDLLMTLLPASRTAGESAAEYFELLFKMIEPEEARLYLTVRGFLRTACGLITEEVTRVEAQERSYHTDISQGYILNKLIELLNNFLRVPNIRTRFMKESLLSQVLEALLVIRGLVVQKTKLVSDCGRLLGELLDNLLQESYENKRHFIRACVSGLQVHHQNRNRRSLFVLEQLCNIICPTKPEPVYMLVLNKAHTQEEFIRGSMTKNPYSSQEVGPLMRDVKNKICQQLELLGLLEDDYGMELLVAGNIISLDLTIVLVYEQVWRKAHGANLTSGSSLLVSPGISFGKECPPMTVTYRLQGLDGEATEPMIKELDDDREETQDPEVEFAITGVMNECGGLAVLLKIVQQFTDEELKNNPEQIALVLKLLMFCCKIRKNRETLLQLGALDVLLETARRAFSSESVQALLLIVEYLVSEANESDIGINEDGLSSSSARGEQAAKGVLMFLERLSNTTSTKQSKQHRNSDTVARILPYLTFGEPAAMEVLVDHFMPYLEDWHSFDKLQKQVSENPKDAVVAQKAAQHQLALDNFVKMTESIKLNVFGERLKDLIVEKQIVTVATSYLKKVFPLSEGKDYKTSPEWNEALELASVPIVLSMLRGLSRGHSMTQECLDTEGILPLLHALEGVSGDNDVGARAENLLDTLSDKESYGEGFLAEKITSLRDTTRDEMRRRALQRREELLQGLGMRRELRSDGGERIIISQPSIEGLEDIEEEEAGLACMVCREGYKLRPTDMLGTYSYSKRVNIGPTGTGQGRAEWAYTTVSHFNVIHFQCHQEAKRGDASLKNPKKEWEGATLRNNETLCNNLFPLRGPAVPLAQYIRCVDTFWDYLNALGRADGSRLRLLTYDIVLMLGRFATGASFSADCKGGGKESNSRLLPFMLQMARHLMDQQGLSQRRVQARSLQTYLNPEAEAPRVSNPGTPTRPTSEDTVQFMMLQSVLLQSHDEWQQHRKTFLRRGASHAYMLHKQGRSMMPASPLPSTTDANKRQQVPDGALTSEQLFNILKPMLVFIGIVDQIQRYLKRGSCSGSKSGSSDESTGAATGGSSGFGGAEPWEIVMKEKLRDVSTMLAFSKELLEWLDDMQTSQDLQEALDVMGALGDVLTSVSSCDHFFLEAIGLPLA